MTDLNAITPRRSLAPREKLTQLFPLTLYLVLFHILRRARIRQAHGAAGAELGLAVCRHKAWEAKKRQHGQAISGSGLHGSLTAKGDLDSQMWHPRQTSRMENGLWAQNEITFLTQISAAPY